MCIGIFIIHHQKSINMPMPITPSQSGFLPGESTTNQLLCIYENLCSNFEKRITTQTVYFDISKAFDRVWHRGPLLKLESICVRGKLLNWFQNYLTDRTQAIAIKGEKIFRKENFSLVSLKDLCWVPSYF